MSAAEKKAVTIGVHGGLVQWIQDIPEDVCIIVRDYDVDGCDEADLTTDPNGDKCVESVWEKEDENG